MNTYTLRQMPNRNYPLPGAITDDLHQWAQSRSTDIAVALAIHAYNATDSERSPDDLWEAPTAAEDEWVVGCLNEWCRGAAIDAGTYHWGMERVHVVAE